MGKNYATVRRKIIMWFEEHGRDFPWRNTQDPYHVLIAEILLRRTTASAVSRVYNDFINRFDSISRLGRARESTIVQSLSTLGLQSKRAHELKKMALFINRHHSGTIPTSQEDLLRLPGVGDYIASAVRNFAYREPVPLVDGNVVHFVSRVFGIDFKGPTDLGAWEFMRKFGGKHQEAKLYWGVIDLVATVCFRQNPRCPICPVSEVCLYSKGESSVEDT
jgi:A/G-specific adenine glycosylase